MPAQNLLVELCVEELPPKALKVIGTAFATLIADSLHSQGLVANSDATAFASPRRLAVHLVDVASKAQDKIAQQKLMPANVGLDAQGNATPALLKRLAALGADAAVVPKLKRANDGKTESLFLDTTLRGPTLAEGLQKALDEMLAKLPIPKVMSYQLSDGWSTVKFVRPAHGLLALHGPKVVPVSLLGLRADRVTRGHRFEAKLATIKLKTADTYAAQLEKEGAVLASFEHRRNVVTAQLKDAAKKLKLRLIEDDALLDEVTALVERPNVLTCEFESEFLEVPQECLILTMKANQKYFPLLGPNGKLSNKFLVVSNIRPASPKRVIEGNERVVRPRLADAKFFFDQDRKRPLIAHLEELGKVVYHNKLGSQLDRVKRIEMLAEFVREQLPNSSATKQTVSEAAQLCKCDLLTLMVGEFPELQGVMGRYYALAEGKSAEIAESIREHYLPRGAGDELPATVTGIAVALADKIDTISGVFAIDQKPTGAKDPFGVRRAAIGILRIMVERKLSVDLTLLIAKAVELQPAKTNDSVAKEIYDYVLERLRGYYLEDHKLGVTTEMFDAVLANRPQSPLDFDRRLHALLTFLKLPDAQSLAAANKRIGNILRKSGQDNYGIVRKDLLRDDPEKTLHEEIEGIVTTVEPKFANREYAEALKELARLRGSVDAFFDKVLVMADDEAVRNNRLALLATLRRLFLRVADLSRLPG